MVLDEGYVPGFLKFSGTAPQDLSPDGAAVFHITW
jgi:hypothetical protein